MTFHSPLTLAALVIWLAVFLTLLRTTMAPIEARDTPRPGPDPVEEIELLRYENALLRAEQQRVLSLGAVGERIRGQIGSGSTPGSDGGDEAWGALVDATVLRETLLSVCQDLQTAVRHVQVQLSSGVPLPEHDRRRSDRSGG